MTIFIAKVIENDTTYRQILSFWWEEKLTVTLRMTIYGNKGALRVISLNPFGRFSFFLKYSISRWNKVFPLSLMDFYKFLAEIFQFLLFSHWPQW